MLQTDQLSNYWLKIFDLPALDALIKGENRVAGSLPARFVGSAYDPDGDPEEARFGPIEVFAVGDDEYLVPTKAKWKGGHVTEHTVRLDHAEKIITRPLDGEGRPTRNIAEMERSKEIDPDVRESLLAIVHRRYKPKTGYSVQVIEPH